jgi:hypothetical protein
MNIHYVFFGFGVVCIIVAGLLTPFSWGLLLSGISLAVSGWSRRNVEPSPWMKHSTIRDTARDTVN